MIRENKLLGVGLITAITASLCCITPVLALIAGTSGMVSNFGWIEPFRPYLIVLTVLVLGFAWYQALIPEASGAKKGVDCKCDRADMAGQGRKSKFIKSKTFLGIVTVFTILMLAFPSYSGIFYPNTEKHIMVVDKSDITTTEFKISGMTCSGCEKSVKHEVNKLFGIITSKVSYDDKNAIIEFDKTKTNEAEIEKAINSTGYKVTEKNQTH